MAKSRKEAILAMKVRTQEFKDASVIPESERIQRLRASHDAVLDRFMSALVPQGYMV